MKVSIMQPNVFMWGGLLKTIIDSDLHIVLDIVKSSKNCIYNRNRIAGEGTPVWLTIPFIDFKRSKIIKDQKLDTSNKTILKIENIFKNRYSSSAYYENGLTILNSTLQSREQESNLISIYIQFLNSLKSLGIPLSNIEFASNIISKSTLDPNYKGADLINFLLKNVEADTYLASENTVKYCSPNQYVVKKVCIQKYISSNYKQNKSGDIPFIPNLSCLDFISHLNNNEVIKHLESSNSWEIYLN